MSATAAAASLDVESDSGLFSIRTQKVAPLTPAAFQNLEAHLSVNNSTGSQWRGDYKEDWSVLHPSVIDAVGGIKELPEKIDPSTARLEKNENACDLLVLTYNDTSKNGIVFVSDRGVYLVSGGEFSWRDTQECDLYFALEDDKLKFDSLK